MRTLLLALSLALAIGTDAMGGNYGSDPDAVILTFDMTGGQKPRRDGPILQIHADGSVVARAARPGNPSVKSKLTAARMNRLFAELVEKHDILSLTQPGLQAEFDRFSQMSRRIADAPTTKLSVTLPGGTVAVHAFAVSRNARQNPDAEKLNKLHAIQLELLDTARAILRDAS